jgi:hypothetical protein
MSPGSIAVRAKFECSALKSDDPLEKHSCVFYCELVVVFQCNNLCREEDCGLFSSWCCAADSRWQDIV